MITKTTVPAVCKTPLACECRYYPSFGYHECFACGAIGWMADDKQLYNHPKFADKNGS